MNKLADAARQRRKDPREAAMKAKLP